MVGGLIDVQYILVSVRLYVHMYVYVCTVHMANMGPCLMQQSRAPSATASIPSDSVPFSFLMLTRDCLVQSERVALPAASLDRLMHDMCLTID